jgi:DNA-directed RNA polymerase subunit RPC12/RpoP
MKPKTLRWDTDFRCLHCGYPVSANPLLSAVGHRNHCPYCLWSRHLDLSVAGDRLSACKAPMRPLGLTFKQAHKKYSQAGTGEMMLVHICTDCGRVSLNRIAADDDVDGLLETFERSLGLDWRTRLGLAQSGIHLANVMEESLVRLVLFGRISPVELRPEMQSF